MSAAAASANGSTSATAKAAPSASSSSSFTPKHAPKPNPSAKTLDGARKQASSPVDTSSTKRSTPKAWQGTNPITQRASTPNGVSNGAVKNSPAPAKATNSTSPPDTGAAAAAAAAAAGNPAYERLLFLVANFAGLHGRILIRNGERFEGILSGANLEAPDPRFLMKMTKRTFSATSPPSKDSEILNTYIGTGNDHVMAFDLQDIVDLHVSDVLLSASEAKGQNGTGSSFRTDAEISGATGPREKELQKWQAGPETAVDLSWDVSALGNWDQFETNRQKFGVETDYSDDLYTTSIDRTAPRYREWDAQATRIAKEIAHSEAANSHVAEERKMDTHADGGLGEEEKYSGVARDITPLIHGRTNAYVPPSKRPITSLPTVAGAPFDPAIISAQVSRPAPPTAVNSETQAHASNVTPSEVSRTPPALSAQPGIAANPPISVTGPGQSIAASLAASLEPAPVPAPKTPRDGPAEGVERKLLNSFKQFSNEEKLKVQNHQRAQLEKQRVTARQEKSVKLNDLKKFAENFKLYSRVPDDLVPILAKTKEKQTQIVTKAEQQALEKEHRAKTTPVTPAITPSKPDVDNPAKVPRAAPVAGRPDAGQDLASPFAHRQRIAQNQNFRAQNQPLHSPRGPGPVNPRIQPSQPPHRGNAPGPPPVADLRIPPAGPGQPRGAETALMSPDSAASTRFNVKAMEFKPNPAASNFTPGPAKSSPQEAKRPSVSAVAASPPPLFAKLIKPISERMPYDTAFDAIKRLKQKAETEGKAKDYSANGGIPQAYRTLPTWECPPSNQEKSYAQSFQQALAATISPIPTPSHGGIPYQYQLPVQVQTAPPQLPSGQTPRFPHAQPHQFPNQHMDDRMQYASSNSSVQPSPRMGHPAMAYNAQMHPQMPGYPGGMPPYAMSPAGVPMRPMPSAPQFGGPQGPQMGGHMMMQQPSNGPFMNGPMGQQMYPSPGPGHVQPHFPGHAQQPGGPHYAPSPRAHPMSHQGSQQGHQPVPPVYMVQPGGPMMMQQHPGQMPMRNFPQPQYQGGPHPGYPMQHRQMSGGGYNHQMTPRQHHAAPQQGGPSGNVAPMHSAAPGDEGK